MTRLILLTTALFLFACTGTTRFDEAKAKEEILALERLQRAVHFQKRAVDFADLLAPDHISINRGQISHPTRAELEQRFQRYFEQVEFLRWDDEQPPIIHFSTDGSHAVSVLKKEVITHHLDGAGLIQTTTPFAWTSIYRPYAGDWKIAAVTSTNQESRQDTLHNIVAVADCRGPEGPYRTLLHTEADGYLYFEQQRSGEESFRAVVWDDSTAYALDDQGQVTDPLTFTVIQMLQGHNVFWMRLQPTRFFTDIQREKDGQEATALDQLGHPVRLFFDARYYRLQAVHLQNPLDTSELIEIHIDAERESPFGALPERVRFIQAQRDTFYFDFTSIQLNSPDPKPAANPH